MFSILLKLVVLNESEKYLFGIFHFIKKIKKWIA